MILFKTATTARSYINRDRRGAIIYSASTPSEIPMALSSYSKRLRYLYRHEGCAQGNSFTNKVAQEAESDSPVEDKIFNILSKMSAKDIKKHEQDVIFLTTMFNTAFGTKIAIYREHHSPLVLQGVGATVLKRKEPRPIKQILIDMKNEAKKAREAKETRFASLWLTRPKMSFKDYLTSRIYKYCKPEKTAIAMALNILKKFIENKYFYSAYLDELKQYPHKIFAVCLLIAMKFVQDDFYTNEYYARVFDLSLKELNKLEKIMLVDLLDFKIGSLAPGTGSGSGDHQNLPLPSADEVIGELNNIFEETTHNCSAPPLRVAWGKLS